MPIRWIDVRHEETVADVETVARRIVARRGRRNVWRSFESAAHRRGAESRESSWSDPGVGGILRNRALRFLFIGPVTTHGRRPARGPTGDAELLLTGTRAVIR